MIGTVSPSPIDGIYRKTVWLGKIIVLLFPLRTKIKTGHFRTVFDVLFEKLQTRRVLSLNGFPSLKFVRLFVIDCENNLLSRPASTSLENINVSILSVVFLTRKRVKKGKRLK